MPDDLRKRDALLVRVVLLDGLKGTPIIRGKEIAWKREMRKRGNHSFEPGRTTGKLSSTGVDHMAAMPCRRTELVHWAAGKPWRPGATLRVSLGEQRPLELRLHNLGTSDDSDVHWSDILQGPRWLPPRILLGFSGPTEIIPESIEGERV